MAAIFNSSSDKIVVPVTTGPIGSIAWFIKPNWSDTDSAAHFFFEATSGSDDLGAQKYSDNNAYVGWIQGSDYRITAGTASYHIASGLWVPQVFTWNDTSNLSQYFCNGALIKTAASLTTVAMTSFTLGNSVAPSTNLDGKLARVEFWNRELTVAEVLLYSMGGQVQNRSGLTNRFDLLSDSKDSVGAANGTDTSITYDTDTPTPFSGGVSTVIWL